MKNAKYNLNPNQKPKSVIAQTKQLKKLYRCFKIISIRIVLIFICVFILLFELCITNSKGLYYWFILPMGVIFVEAFYIILKREGHDFRWYR